MPGSGTVFRASYGRTLETPYNEEPAALERLRPERAIRRGAAPATWPAQSGGIRHPAGRRPLAGARLRLFRQAHRQRATTSACCSTRRSCSRSHGITRGSTASPAASIWSSTAASAPSSSWRTPTPSISPPGTGGILLEQPDGDFRIDHDQKFNATTNLQYVFRRPLGAWAALSWRYDSGLVAGSVASIDDALALTGDQQAAIGFYCGSVVATRDAPITNCDSGGGATRLKIPAEGTADDVNNPPRIAPRHLFDLGLGVDNLLRGDKAKVRVRFSVINLTNKEALYNFLSTFTGTHFVTPRAYQVQVGRDLLSSGRSWAPCSLGSRRSLRFVVTGASPICLREGENVGNTRPFSPHHPHRATGLVEVLRIAIIGTTAGLLGSGVWTRSVIRSFGSRRFSSAGIRSSGPPTVSSGDA